MKQYTPEEILEKVRDIIMYFNAKRETISDEEMGDLRTKLATGTYIMVEEMLQPSYKEFIAKEVELERVEGRIFKQLKEEFLAKKCSVTSAMEQARKELKSNEEYLTALREAGDAKQYSYLLNKLLDQANQILNSMSRKTRY